MSTYFRTGQHEKIDDLEDKIGSIKISFTLKNDSGEDAILGINKELLAQILQLQETGTHCDLHKYKIHELQTNPLRGFNKMSLEIPGRNGENLDKLIITFDKEEWEMLRHHSYFINWLDDDGIIIENERQLELQNLKLRSESRLYLKDRYMSENQNIFSVENANEGALHILFYLALFISSKTPNFFAVDNIENALNPHLCRMLMKNIATLAKKKEKQALITTHNPAILDGLNLQDQDQRLFVVSRNRKGHTSVKRIELKPNVEVDGVRLKLSELWMRNYLGGLPQNF